MAIDLISDIAPQNDGDFPMVEGRFVQAGAITVATIAARDALLTKPGRLEVGQLVFIDDGTDKLYKLDAGKASWTEVSLGGGGGGTADNVKVPVPVSLTRVDIVVRPTGNDTTGDGTLGTPYLTLARALQDVPQFLPQSTYYVIDITGIDEDTGVTGDAAGGIELLNYIPSSFGGTELAQFPNFQEPVGGGFNVSGVNSSFTAGAQITIISDWSAPLASATRGTEVDLGFGVGTTPMRRYNLSAGSLTANAHRGQFLKQGSTAWVIFDNGTTTIDVVMRPGGSAPSAAAFDIVEPGAVLNNENYYGAAAVITLAGDTRVTFCCIKLGEPYVPKKYAVDPLPVLIRGRDVTANFVGCSVADPRDAARRTFYDLCAVVPSFGVGQFVGGPALRSCAIVGSAVTGLNSLKIIDAVDPVFVQGLAQNGSLTSQGSPPEGATLDDVFLQGALGAAGITVFAAPGGVELGDIYFLTTPSANWLDLDNARVEVTGGLFSLASAPINGALLTNNSVLLYTGAASNKLQINGATADYQIGANAGSAANGAGWTALASNSDNDYGAAASASQLCAILRRQ